MAVNNLRKKNWLPTIGLAFVAVAWLGHTLHERGMDNTAKERIEGAGLMLTGEGFRLARNRVDAIEARADKTQIAHYEQGLVWAFWCVVRDAGYTASDETYAATGKACVGQLKANKGILPK